MKKQVKIIILILAVGLNYWILTRPNIVKPFSPYSAYDEGYKSRIGKYPDNCPSLCCKVHGKGFIYNLFFKKYELHAI